MTIVVNNGLVDGHILEKCIMENGSILLASQMRHNKIILASLDTVASVV